MFRLFIVCCKLSRKLFMKKKQESKFVGNFTKWPYYKFNECTSVLRLKNDFATHDCNLWFKNGWEIFLRLFGSLTPHLNLSDFFVSLQSIFCRWCMTSCFCQVKTNCFGEDASKKNTCKGSQCRVVC